MEQIKKLIDANDLDSAEKRIEHLRSQRGNNNDLTFLMGVIYHKRNDIDNALATFSMLAASNNKDYRSLFNIGLIHEKRGNKEYAKEMYETVLALKSDHKLALDGLKRITKYSNNPLQKGSIEYGDLIFEWSPKITSSNIYYLYAGALFIPFLFILINLLIFNFKLEILNVISGFCGVLGLICTPYSIWCFATALRMAKSRYKIYENIIEVKICEGFSIKHNIITMYDLRDIELKTSFPLTFTDDAFISIPYDINSNGTIRKYHLFTNENYEKTKMVFDYIKSRSYKDKQDVTSFKR